MCENRSQNYIISIYMTEWEGVTRQLYGGGTAAFQFFKWEILFRFKNDGDRISAFNIFSSFKKAPMNIEKWKKYMKGKHTKYVVSILEFWETNTGYWDEKKRVDSDKNKTNK